MTPQNREKARRERYFLTVTTKTEVSKDQFIRAERDAGFFPKNGGEGCATSGFGNDNVQGTVTTEWNVNGWVVRPSSTAAVALNGNQRKEFPTVDAALDWCEVHI